MKILAGTLLFIALAAACALGQSGRRIEPSPTPQAPPLEIPLKAPELPYSESTPVEKRPIYRRPAKAEKRDKKDKKDRKEGRDTNLSPGGGADAGAGNSAADDGEVIKVDTKLVTVPVSVFDRNGLYIPNLKQTDFKVFDNGEEQPITYFGSSEKPFTVALLLDTSPSTEYKIEEIQQAAIAFVDQLKPQDKVLVIEFDGNVHVLSEATSDRETIYKAIRKADFGGGTSLYDAVSFTLLKRLRATEGRKAIVLFTDGVDTTSHKEDYDSTVALAEETETLVFPIYYNTYSDSRLSGLGFPLPGGMMSTRGTSAEEYATGKKFLEDLAAYTGGRVFQPQSTPGGLTRAFEGIAEELRRQYVIGYVPGKDGVPGERRQIKVRVDRPNLVLRARDSYIVNASPSVASAPAKQ